MRVTGHAQRDAWNAGVLPPIEQVRAGVWSLPVPIPHNPLRYTLTYLIEAADRLVLVDPGWDTRAGWTALTEGVATAGARWSDITGVVVTHVHPDHHGLSARVREVSDAWVAMHPAEAASLPARTWNQHGGSSGDERWLRRCGLPPDALDDLTLPAAIMAPFLAMAEPDLLLADGDLVPVAGRRLRAIWTPGHTPGHLCLHDEGENLLLTGDHVLPRISPNIGLQPHAADPPLADYLDSLTRIADFDGAEVLPAHEYRFRGLADRVRVLLRHHDHRCAEILTVLDRYEHATIWQVAGELSWSRGWSAVTGFMRRAAIAETAAHLLHLRDLGQVDERASGPADPLVYSTLPPSAWTSRGDRPPCGTVRV